MRIRYYLSTVVILSALEMCIPASLNADAIVSAGPAVSLDVPVNVSNVSDLFAFQFDLAYDPTVVKLLSISEGSFLPTAGATGFVAGTIDNTAGTATFTADALVGAVPGASGSGTLAVFNFMRLSQAVSPLTLSNVTLLDSALNPIAFDVSNGQVDSAVPEPSALPLLGVMLGSALVCKLRKRATLS